MWGFGRDLVKIWSVICSSVSPKLVGVCGDVGLWSGLDEIFFILVCYIEAISSFKF